MRLPTSGRIFRGKDMKEREMFKVSILAAFVAAAFTGEAMAAEVTVKMLNKGSDGTMVFEPAFVKVAPGDTVRFVATHKSHNAETMAGMLPSGAAPFKGKMNQDVTVKFTKPGVYGVECLPHHALGMVALIQVGKAGNLAQAKSVKHPPLAQRRLDRMFQLVK